MLLPREPFAGLPGLAQHLRQLARVEVTLIEETFRSLDHGRDDPRLRDDAAHRADAAVVRCDRADLEREPRRARERVAALVHRRRAGVRRLTAERDARALDAERAEHDAQRQIHRLEHRPLLDVQLEVGGRGLELTPRVECAVEVDPVGCERVRQRDAVAIRQLPQLVLVVHRARRRARAEERAAEARALLVGPVDEAHGRSRLAQPAHHLHAGEDVQRPVQPAPVRNRVDVSPDQHGLPGAARQRPPLVSGRVHLGIDRHLLVEPLLRAHPGVRPGDPLRAVLVAGELLQLAELGNRS